MTGRQKNKGADGDAKRLVMREGVAFRRLIEKHRAAGVAKMLGVSSGRITNLQEKNEVPAYIELACEYLLDEGGTGEEQAEHLPAVRDTPIIILVRVPRAKADAAQTVLHALGADVAALPDG